MRRAVGRLSVRLAVPRGTAARCTAACGAVGAARQGPAQQPASWWDGPRGIATSSAQDAQVSRASRASRTAAGATRVGRGTASSFEAEREARTIMKTLQSLRGAKRAAYFDSIAEQNKANIFHCNAMLGSCETPQQARKFLERMRGLGIMPDVVSYTAMMQIEIRCAGIGAAEALLREMMAEDPPVMPNVRTHLVLIEGHGKRGRLEDAVAAWQRMLKQGIAANEYIYTALIDACAKRMDVQTAERVMRAAWDDPSIKPNVQMLTSIIDLHARAGQHGKVKAVWEQMEARGVEPDTAAVNAVITALDKSGSLEEAREVFLRVRSEQRVRLDCVSYSAMLDAYAKRGLVAEAAALLEEMRASGIAPDSAMLVSLVDLYGKSGAPHKARQALHALCDYASRHLEDAAVQQADGAGRAGAAGEKQGAAGGRGSSASMVRSDVRRAFNTLIDANLRFGQAEAARSLRKELDEAAGRGLSAAADVFTYTILVGHIEVGPEAAGEARALYDDMMAARVAPDAAFFFSALEVIVKSGDLESAAAVFEQARNELLDPFDHCFQWSAAAAKLDMHGLPRAAAAAALEWALRLDPRQLAPGPEHGGDLVLVTGREQTYVGEANLIRELVIKALTAKGVRFWAADSANRRARFPKGAGRLVVPWHEWLKHRESPCAHDYFEYEFR